MENKFQNKYRIPSARLQSWDYANEGAYFITICTKHRKHYFGEIENEKMILSNAGILADVFWYEIKKHAKDIELGEFVVMPNHIHGILIVETLHATSKNQKDIQNETLHATSEIIPNMDSIVSTASIETLHATSLPPNPPNQSQPHKNEQMEKISPKSNSVSTIIRSYKSAVTKHCNRLGIEFAWQPRFYDHIIRDVRSFENIQNYIVNNPVNWGKDKFHGN